MNKTDTDKAKASMIKLAEDGKYFMSDANGLTKRMTVEDVKRMLEQDEQESENQRREIEERRKTIEPLFAQLAAKLPKDELGQLAVAFLAFSVNFHQVVGW